ncbi:MAG: DNA polymerase III subunit gamma/tau [Phycisphaeraceae bacterium]|nr:DNA polymerase III subunit gamma/tau [Phycisphaeraceae bacterium]
MAYTALARRYRSQSFDQVVGQDAIAQTLKNAIATDRVGHAYLFCGTRGVGKTSMARIFAKAINTPDDQPPDVAAAIMRGQDTDVIEIDAASNSRVEETRELIANSVYRPLRGRKKIYIIDEVHMLSTHAFNALLKTMEEPPDHVVFILCTTETHKVPATIQSRCQRFEFRNIPTAEIARHLADVVKHEKVKADAELLHAVARLGNGSMRDALSLLDRLIAAGEKELTPALLERLLGLPEREVIERLITAVADGSPAAALQAADELAKRGVSGEMLLSTLAERYRDLLMIVACGDSTDLVDLSPDARQWAVQTARRFDDAALTHLIALCDSVARTLRLSAAPRAMLDAAIVRMAITDKLADVAGLLESARAAAPTTTGARAAPNGPARAPVKK